MERNVFIMLIALSVLSSVLPGCKKNEKQQSEKVDTAQTVSVEQVSLNAENAIKSYVGIIQEKVSIPLSFLASGSVLQVYVSEGQAVHRGQLLALLNGASYRSSLNAALAKRRQAQDAYNRLSVIYKKGSLPEVKMVEVETGLAETQSFVQIAKKNLQDCRLYAPTDGVIGKRMIEPGMNAIPGNPVFNVLKINVVYAVASIPENEIAQIHIGQSASVVVSALGNKQFEGRVTEKGVEANPMSHTYDVKIAISNEKRSLRPGMVCNVVMTRKAVKQISAPFQSVMTDGQGQRYVFVYNKKTGKAEKRTVGIGSLCGNGDVEVVSGLSDGDILIVEGYQRINENTPVKIIR